VALQFLIEDVWYEVATTDEREVASALLLVPDAGAREGVLVPRDDGHPVLHVEHALLEPKQQQALVLVTSSLAPVVFRLLSASFLAKAAATISEGRNTAPLIERELGDWGLASG